MTKTRESDDLVRGGKYGKDTHRAFQERPETPLPDWRTHTGSATNEELLTLVRAVGQLAQHAPGVLRAAIKGKTIIPIQVMDAMELLAVQPVNGNDPVAAQDVASAWQALWNTRQLRNNDPTGRKRLRSALLVRLMGEGQVPIKDTKRFLDSVDKDISTTGTGFADEGFRFLMRCALEEIGQSKATPKPPRM